MQQNHAHHHDETAAHAAVSSSKMGWAVALTLAFVTAEVVAGYFAHSLALLSDAGHNFADAAALGFSWYALWVARKPSHQGMTFGYHRVGILAALVNAVSLVVIALIILVEAIERLRNPQPVQGWMMIALASIAVLMNLLIGAWLHAGAKHNINVRAAYLHMIGDAISAVGVVVAGILILIGGWQMADPIVSFLIAILILLSGWGILKESVNILLEGAPQGMNMSAVEQCIATVPGVLGVHDLHVWTVGPGAVACSCHILVAEQTIREGQQILKTVVEILEQHHKINHTTVQVEVQGHASNEMYCSIEPNPDAAHVGHQH
jgi:cobalt-zinc-cadmium efflux system protein